MRQIAIVPLVAAACFSQAQLKYAVYVNGTKIGTAIVTEKLTAQGKTENMHLTVNQAGQNVTMSSSSTFDAKGIQRVEALTIAANAISKIVAVTFKGDKATINSSENGAKSTTTATAPAGATLSDPSEYWFMKSKPKVGAVVKASKFNVQTLSWEDTVSKYVGDEQVSVAGKKLNGHKVTTVHGGATGTVYLDDKGDILVYEENSMRLERTN